MTARNRPLARRDAHGECLHLYLTRDAKCVHCGMQFGLAWSADRDWLTKPLRRNIIFGLGSFVIFGVLFLLQVTLIPLVLLFLGVYFFVRVFFGTVETFMKHRFVPGKLGVLIPRGQFNVGAMKPAYAYIGRAKFPMDIELYSQFSEGETLLVEHLRWSRLPIAIYRGHHPH
jgi:hypothetical protein